GWASRHQQGVITYLKAENRILRQQLGRQSLRFTDAERRRLAELGKALVRKTLGTLDALVTPDTILRWYRQLVAAKYYGTCHRRAGRPPTRRARPEPRV